MQNHFAASNAHEILCLITNARYNIFRLLVQHFRIPSMISHHCKQEKSEMALFLLLIHIFHIEVA